ncbi:NADAR domain-containing protein [Streptococcus parasanguinis]|nr:NADAR domain-containing protein [Streptococcus parasanguinis]
MLATGDVIIIEHTQNDAYWADGGDGSGKNKLGLLLMKVRKELKNATL